MNLFPAYSRGEQLADGLVHAVGLALSLVAMAFLLYAAFGESDGSGGRSVSLILYGLALVAVFVASAAYNLLTRSSRRELYRRLDRAAIYLKIAGTYTPFAFTGSGAMLNAVLSGVWIIAIVAIPIQLWAPTLLQRLGPWLYLTQGWLVLLAIEPLSAAVSTQGVALILTGGILYTVGVVFFLAQRLRYHNAIWHGFVVVASACMFAAVYGDVVLAAE